MGTRIGVLMDSIDAINPEKDTSFALLLAAQHLGCEIFVFSDQDIHRSTDGFLISVETGKFIDQESEFFTARSQSVIAAQDLDVIFMRKDPPVDANYLHACQLLCEISEMGVQVVNAPEALIQWNEKLLAMRFAALTPPSLYSYDKSVIRLFFETHGKCVFKPVDGMGGEQIFVLDSGDKNFNVVVDGLTNKGRCGMIIQKFIPAIADGDNRLLILNGEPLPSVVARHAVDGESRANLAQGGTAHVRSATPKELEIGRTVGQFLMQQGVSFAGLDIIGERLTEVNITSPTCMREYMAQTANDPLTPYLETLIRGKK